MHQRLGDMNRITRFQDAHLRFYPLFCRAGQDIQNLLQTGVIVKIMECPRGELGANEVEFVGVDQAGLAVPVVRLGRGILDLSLGFRDEVA